MHKSYDADLYINKFIFISVIIPTKRKNIVGVLREQ